MTTKYKHINLDYLHSISKGDKQIEERMLKSYIRSIPGYIKEMSLTFDNGSWHLLGNAAYRAKDIMPIIGLKQLALDLNELDLLCRDGEDIKGIKQYVDVFSKVGNEAVKEIAIALKELRED